MGVDDHIIGALEAKGEGKRCEVEKAAETVKHRQQEDQSALKQSFPEDTHSSEVLSSDFSKETEGSTFSSQTQPGEVNSHQAGTCRPCGFFWRPGGCAKGAACTFCHICKPNHLKAKELASLNPCRRLVVSL
mmetsp:Transcript_154461/g.375014  ORF Transcript_154461/g.375014 Transcript_154461/m.375014 type:complete len:132 (+) Transcript_154461:109-504(+)